MLVALSKTASYSWTVVNLSMPILYKWRSSCFGVCTVGDLNCIQVTYSMTIATAFAFLCHSHSISSCRSLHWVIFSSSSYYYWNKNPDPEELASGSCPNLEKVKWDRTWCPRTGLISCLWILISLSWVSIFLSGHRMMFLMFSSCSTCKAHAPGKRRLCCQVCSDTPGWKLIFCN